MRIILIVLMGLLFAATAIDLATGRPANTADQVSLLFLSLYALLRQFDD